MFSQFFRKILRPQPIPFIENKALLLVSRTECTVIFRSKERYLQRTINFELSPNKPSATIEVTAAMIQIFEEILETIPNKNISIQVLIDSSITRYFMVTPFQNTHSISDARDAATHRFIQLYGQEQISLWDIRGDWNASEIFLGAAIPKIWIQQIVELQKHRRLHVSSILPLASYIFHELQPKLKLSSFLLIKEQFSWLLFICDQRKLISVRTFAREYEDEQTNQIVHSLILRESINLGITTPKEVLVFGSEILQLPQNSSIHLNRASNLTSSINDLHSFFSCYTYQGVLQ